MFSSRLWAAALAAAAIVVVLSAPGASAATVLGSTCTATSAPAIGLKTLYQIDRTAGAPTQTAAPGVVTKWSVGIGGSVTARSEKLKVFKLSGKEVEAVAESEAATVSPGAPNEFATRIPVPAGVHFGAYSGAAVPVCTGSTGDEVGYLENDVAVKTKAPVTTGTKAVVALSITIEPDADADGFGDETQDQCLLAVGPEAGCPLPVPPPPGNPPGGSTGGGSTGGGSTGGDSSPATLSLTVKSRLEGNLVTALLTANAQASLTVTGSLKAKRVTGPVTVDVQPGQTGRAYLRLPKGVRETLAKLPRKRRLHLVLGVTATAANGATGSASIEQALPGRRKPAKHQSNA